MKSKSKINDMPKVGRIRIGTENSIKDYSEYIYELGEIVHNIDRKEKGLSYVKIGDGKHKYSELPYKILPFPDIMDIKSWNYDKTTVKYTDFHGNTFIRKFDENGKTVYYEDSSGYKMWKEYDEYGKVNNIKFEEEV